MTYLEDLAKFLILFFTPFTLIHFMDFSLLTSFLSSLEGFLLSKLGFTVFVSKSFLTINSAQFLITVDCTGLVLIILLFALFLSTGTGNFNQFILFSILLFLFNIIRLLLTLEVGGVYGLNAMESTHVSLWFVDSAVVFLIWLGAGGFI
ncbi:MAG: hypothetical protein M1594_01540 [Candidatus Marsarchaeota archaeon]|nr:hypothetical protein [Candidatus Marsarchaeota archaeon]